jgi:hypothetical protein
VVRVNWGKLIVCDDCFSAMKAAHEDARKTLWDKPKDLWTFRMERVGENEGGRSQVIPENVRLFQVVVIWL